MEVGNQGNEPVKKAPQLNRRQFIKSVVAAIGLTLNGSLGNAPAQAEGRTSTENIASKPIDVIVSPNATEVQIQQAIIERLLKEPRTNAQPLGAGESSIKINGAGSFTEKQSFKVQVSKTGPEVQASASQESEPVIQNLEWTGAPIEGFNSETKAVSSIMKYSVGDTPVDSSIFHFIQKGKLPIYDIEAYRGFLVGDGEIESSQAIDPQTESIKYTGVLVDAGSHVTKETTKLFARTKDDPSKTYLPLAE
jgi:hypothetical protein